jgi:hypothetical protein
MSYLLFYLCLLKLFAVTKKVAYFLHKAVLHYKIIPELYAVVCTKFTFICVHTAVLQV